MNMLLPALCFGPMVCALLCYLAGRARKGLRNVLVGVTGVLTFAGCLLLLNRELSWTLPGFCGLGISFRAEGFRGLYACVASFMWMLTGLFSPEYFAHYHNRNRYYFFNLMTLGATLGVFLSDDLYTAFIFFEVMSLCSYVWVAHEENQKAMKAAATYLSVAVIGGLAALMGLFLLWHDFGTLSYTGLREAAHLAPLMEDGAAARDLRIASWLILLGFGAKAGIFPLHIWLPKAHPVAPAPASALLSGILTKSGVFGLMVVCADLRPGLAGLNNEGFGNALLVLGVITMLMGAVLALFSVDLKRVLACSSMSQIGFITVGFAVSVLLGEEGGLAAGGSVLHMVNHSLIKLCLFMCAGVVYMNLHKLDLNDIRGFGRRKPVLHLCFLLGAIAIACLPPLGSGFASKSLIHEGLLEYIAHLRHVGGAWMPVKAAELLFLFSGGLTIAYMTKLYICIFWQKNGDSETQARYDGMKKYLTPFSACVLLLSALVLPALGLLPDMLMKPLAERSMDFLHLELPHHIEFFSGENLLGAAESAAIGILVYLLAVRLWLMKKQDGLRVYADRWPARWDLEDRVYRPLLLTVLPTISTLAARAVADLPEWLVLLCRRTVLRKKMAAAEIPVGNRLTYTVGCCWNACARRLNGTVLKEHPMRTDMEYAAGEWWGRIMERSERMTRSVSYSLLLMAVGLLITCIYLLLVS